VFGPLRAGARAATAALVQTRCAIFLAVKAQLIDQPPIPADFDSGLRSAVGSDRSGTPPMSPRHHPDMITHSADPFHIGPGRSGHADTHANASRADQVRPFRHAEIPANPSHGNRTLGPAGAGRDHRTTLTMENSYPR
jgi:hypothetical protein